MSRVEDHFSEEYFLFPDVESSSLLRVTKACIFSEGLAGQNYQISIRRVRRLPPTGGTSSSRTSSSLYVSIVFRSPSPLFSRSASEFYFGFEMNFGKGSGKVVESPVLERLFARQILKTLFLLKNLIPVSFRKLSTVWG